MAAQDPELGIEEKHLKVLESSLFVDPNQIQTPFQRLIDRFQKEQQLVTEQRAQERAKRI